MKKVTKMEYDECSVKFTGKSDCDESYSKVFDNLVMEAGEIEEDEVEYDCTFDMDTLQYHLVMNLVDEDGNQIDTEELLDDCFWGLFAAIVAAIVVVYHVNIDYYNNGSGFIVGYILG